MSKLVLVDVSNFVFRAFYAIRPLTTPDGRPVNAVYGFYTMMQKLLAEVKPDAIVCARESRSSVRKDLYPEYKANRGETPPDLISQFPLITELIDAMALPQCSSDGHEADDVIGSLAIQWGKDFDEVLIASSDKDLYQFVDKKVKLIDMRKDIMYGAKEVEKKLGVRPDQVRDYLSLVGDSSDNIPGARGIGPKGAQKLLHSFERLDEIYKNIEKIENKRLKTALENSRDEVFLSQKLVTINTKLNLSVSLEDSYYNFTARPELINFLQDLNFSSQVKKLESMRPAESEEKIIECEEVNSFKKFSEKIKNTKTIYCLENDEGIYFFIESVFCILDEDLKRRVMFHLWEGDFLIVTDNAKGSIRKLFEENKTRKAQHFDLLVAAYIIDPQTPSNANYVLNKYLDAHISDDAHEAEKVSLLPSLYHELKKQIDERESRVVFETIEAPLTALLARMENVGIGLDSKFLVKLEKNFREKVKSIEDRITGETGEEINLKSPKQVSELLFEKLSYPVIKRTKTGISTDSQVLEELRKRKIGLLPELLLQHREYEKLLSTYVSVLPAQMSSKDNRVHTSFNQRGTATGRLSSERPNLQNIPVRGKEGRKIRKAFVADKGKVFLSADYSQIELRLLAHFSEDERMIKAFKDDLDIHRQTAAEVLSLDLDKVGDEERSKAKAVNFGLMYGQTSFGLSRSLGISRKEAKEYIENYFERFQQVRVFLDDLKESCAKKGYAETFYGRRRYLPEIHAQNRIVKANAERMAINTPIQGTAADLLKLAMVTINDELRRQKYSSEILLQVHDELILEIPKDELTLVKKIVVEKMEGVASFRVPLKVNLAEGENWFDLK